MTDTINIPRAELQAALDSLQECRQKIAYLLGNIEWYESAQAIDFADISIKAISARFAQPEKEQEPVAWGVMKRGERVYYVNDSRNVCQGYAELYGHRSGYGAGKLDHEVIPLYTAPPHRPWQGLTDAEVEQIVDAYWDDPEMFIEVIEAKLKEKNT